MSLANRLYDRPFLDQNLGKLALYVSGALPDAAVGAAYEGRLQIHNAIGDCWVEVISGTVPDGGAVYVDNATSEVVLAWPTYSESAAAITNPGFEDGTITGWDYTTIGGSGTLVATRDHPDTGGYSAYWAGGKGLGSEGGIECLAVNSSVAKVFPGQRVSGNVRILYNPDGGTPKGSRGQARLHWFDSDGAFLTESLGDLIKTRKHNGDWTNSGVSDVCPPGASTVAIAAWVTATGDGHSYFDNASWDALARVGINTDATLCYQFRVHDAGGRVADWYGCVSVNGFGAQFSDWRYLQIAGGDNTDYSAPAFDDSGWPVGQAPFGNADNNISDPGYYGSEPHDYDNRFAEIIATKMDLDSRVWIRRTLMITEVPEGGFQLVGFFDNNYAFYINGTLVEGGGTPTNGGVTVTIAADKFMAGVNTVAVQCTDTGTTDANVCYFDFLLEPVL